MREDGIGDASLVTVGRLGRFDPKVEIKKTTKVEMRFRDGSKKKYIIGDLMKLIGCEYIGLFDHKFRRFCDNAIAGDLPFRGSTITVLDHELITSRCWECGCSYTELQCPACG
jgi:hypothetical protein